MEAFASTISTGRSTATGSGAAALAAAPSGPPAIGRNSGRAAAMSGCTCTRRSDDFRAASRFMLN
eukprot:4063737-Pyramimonas_sp.AAC.1